MIESVVAIGFAALLGYDIDEGRSWEACSFLWVWV
jgi:hypothetical protein